jgi:hypothetical protein
MVDLSGCCYTIILAHNQCANKYRNHRLLSVVWQPQRQAGMIYIKINPGLQCNFDKTFFHVKSSVFWDIEVFSPLFVPVSCWFLAWLTL